MRGLTVGAWAAVAIVLAATREEQSVTAATAFALLCTLVWVCAEGHKRGRGLW